MKKKLLTLLLLIIPSLLYGQVYTNGIYIEDGKTYEVDKKFHQITNETILYFSNELITKVYTNSDFTINNFGQEISDVGGNISFGVHNFVSTIMKGKVMVTYDGGSTNSSCIISTPLIDCELDKGTFYFEVSDNKTIVCVLDGFFKYSRNNRDNETFVIPSGYYAFVETDTVSEDGKRIDKEKIKKSVIEKLSKESKDIMSLKGKSSWSTKIVGIIKN